MHHPRSYLFALTAIMLFPACFGSNDRPDVELVQGSIAPSDPAPKILLIVADRLGVYNLHTAGKPFVVTPHLDDLARSGLLPPPAG